MSLQPEWERSEIMKIIADTASLISPQEGKEMDIAVIPACVIMGDRSYKDYVDITCEEFVQRLSQGEVPTSSQPAVGELLEELETEEEVLYLSLGSGLSGTYDNALAARNLLEDPQRVHVVDTKTLAGPLRYLVKKAVELRNRGINIEGIKEALKNCIASSVSFVIPEDFDFLRRSGRLTPLTAKIGGVLKLLPVLTQTEDKRRITPVAVKRSWKGALETIFRRLRDLQVGKEHLISVCHGGTKEKALEILEQIKEAFSFSETELLELSPALLTHGGPGCIVIQAVRK